MPEWWPWSATLTRSPSVLVPSLTLRQQWAFHIAPSRTDSRQLFHPEINDGKYFDLLIYLLVLFRMHVCVCSFDIESLGIILIYDVKRFSAHIWRMDWFWLIIHHLNSSRDHFHQNLTYFYITKFNQLRLVYKVQTAVSLSRSIQLWTSCKLWNVSTHHEAIRPDKQAFIHLSRQNHSPILQPPSATSPANSAATRTSSHTLESGWDQGSALSLLRTQFPIEGNTPSSTEHRTGCQ